jgi:hypothetical protein
VGRGSDPDVFRQYVLVGVIRQHRRRDDADDREQSIVMSAASPRHINCVPGWTY